MPFGPRSSTHDRAVQLVCWSGGPREGERGSRPAELPDRSPTWSSRSATRDVSARGGRDFHRSSRPARSSWTGLLEERRPSSRRSTPLTRRCARCSAPARRRDGAGGRRGDRLRHRSARVMAIVCRSSWASRSGARQAWVYGLADRWTWRSGRVVNFVEDDGPDGVARAYPPATLARLARSKAAVDPTNVFHRNHNVAPASGD